MDVGADVGWKVSRCVQLSARSSGSPNCPFNSPQLLLGTVARERYREESDKRLWVRHSFELRETVVLIFMCCFTGHRKEKKLPSASTQNNFLWAIAELKSSRKNYCKKKYTLMMIQKYSGYAHKRYINKTILIIWIKILVIKSSVEFLVTSTIW